MLRTMTPVLLCAALLGGCTLLDRAVDSAMSAAGDKVGNAVGQRVGNSLARRVNGIAMPLEGQLTEAYAVSLFTMLYHHGGYSWTGKAYQPGQFTQWEGPGGERFEKAFLKREKDGKEWWRVRSEAPAEAAGEPGQVAVFEALLSAPSERAAQKIVRMKAKLPGKTQAAEIPITAENANQWMLPTTTRLTPESLAGATVGYEQVKVPAGTFKARHVKFAQTSGRMEWWLSDAVPGGVVKYTAEGSDGTAEDPGVVLRLTKVGGGAKPQL